MTYSERALTAAILERITYAEAIAACTIDMRVQQHIFCPVTGAVMDVQRAYLVVVHTDDDNDGADAVVADHAAAVVAEAALRRSRPTWTVEAWDGAALWRRIAHPDRHPEVVPQSLSEHTSTHTGGPTP
jgi:hypothetical protein